MAASPPTSTVPEQPPENTVTLVEQEHGGALRSGGRPGNTGGTGRPPSLIRAAFRESLADRISLLERIADGESFTFRRQTESDTNGKRYTASGTRVEQPSLALRVQAIEALAKVGMTAPAIEHQDIKTHPQAMAFLHCFRQALVLELAPEVVDRVSSRVDLLLGELPTSTEEGK